RHVEWTGCSLHDLIQPSFSFMVGVALPFSIASRAGKGSSKGVMWVHALWRSLALILLGVVLRSIDHQQTNWTFEDTLSQIGMGYPLLFALGFCSTRRRWFVLLLILAGYWGFFAQYVPSLDQAADLSPIPKDWQHDFTGFATHRNINNNAAWAFDRWFLNLFPRTREFLGNPGGYCTLSFIPTLGTMLLGLLAGQWLKDRQSNRQVLVNLFVAGAVCFALGLMLHTLGICPIVKKIWTPAWTLYSGGWCFWLMAAFYALTDAADWRAWCLPLVVIGANSIAMYVMAHTAEGFFERFLATHFGVGWSRRLAGDVFAPLVQGTAILLILWMILLWMYRRKIFLRI
ncbi:MAG: Protein of unknown function DUF2261,transrane, partial [Verrucomicrobiaceae bacterium]|nr:Protein of unknown function DUF2261,transrane [Verrucomicrobiaceae bacterium]